MKKISLLLAIALFAVTFTSCQKTKPYNPKEKISKIYVDYGLGKTLSESWCWNGKKLKFIEYYNTFGSLQYTDLFNYNEKGQLVKVENDEYNEYSEYIYNKYGRLYQVKYFEDGFNTATWTFEYDDNELTEIVLVSDASKSPSKSLASPLKYVVPELTSVVTDEMLSKLPAERAATRIEIDIDWLGKNISEIEMETGNYKEKYYYRHDDKSNPFRNFLCLEHDDNFGMFNKNNITEVTSTESYMGFSYTDTEYINYTYDGNFPVTKSYDGVIEYYEYE